MVEIIETKTIYIYIYMKYRKNYFILQDLLGMEETENTGLMSCLRRIYRIVAHVSVILSPARI